MGLCVISFAIPQFKESASQNVSQNSFWKPNEISQFVNQNLSFPGDYQNKQNESPRDLRKKRKCQN